MEYVLQNADIFDEDIDVKFNKIITTSKDNFNKDLVYRLTVSFHVNLLTDSRFQEFNVPIRSKTSKGTEKDNIYDVMSFQLKRLEKILEENDIVVHSTTIQGDYLEDENIIKIKIDEDTSESIHNGRKKDKKRMKVSSIMPSRPYTQETVTNLASERISKLYFKLMNAVRNKQIMSEILEIDETEDDEKLFRAFAEQYGELWLTTNKKEKELLCRLKERCIAVIKKHIDEEDKVELE